MVAPQTGDSADSFAHAVIDWSHSFIYHASHRWRRIGELVQHQANMPIGPGPLAQAHQPCANHAANGLFGRQIFIEGSAHRRALRRAHGIPKYFGIQAHLVAKRVVHRRHVSARAAADFPNGRGAVAAFRKNTAGGLDQVFARHIRSVCLRTPAGGGQGPRHRVMSHGQTYV